MVDFTHIVQVCFIGTGASLWLPKWQVRKPEWHEGIDNINSLATHHITCNQKKTKHSKSVYISWDIFRDHFVHAPSPWQTTLQYNVVSHWLGAYTNWFLLIPTIRLNEREYVFACYSQCYRTWTLVVYYGKHGKYPSASVFIGQTIRENEFLRHTAGLQFTKCTWQVRLGSVKGC